MISYDKHRNPQVARGKRGVKDWHLILFVLILVLFNVAIICLHALLEGLVAHFNITTSLNKEMPFIVQGVNIIVVANFNLADMLVVGAGAKSNYLLSLWGGSLFIFIITQKI